MFNSMLLKMAKSFLNTKSLNFDGVDAYVDMGDVFQFDVDDAFSFNLWMKPDSSSLSSQKQLFSKTTQDTNVFGYTLHLQSGDLRIQMRAPSQLRIFTFSSLTPVADTWQMVTLTYGGGQNLNDFRCYLDTVSGGTPSGGTLTNSWLSGQDFFLGQRSNSFHYDGLMDEVTVWDKELSAAEISELYNSGIPNDPRNHSANANLVSYYRMGDAADDDATSATGTIKDVVGSNDGTPRNTVVGDIVEDVPS